jgi:hypothetical protein
MSETKPTPTGTERYKSVTDGDLTKPIELDEFLNGVGLVMRLPAKEDEKAPAPPVATAAAALPKGKRRRKSLIVGACTTLSTILVAVIALRAWDSRYSDVLPSTLIGSWQTDAVKYRDRAFTVSNETLQMQRGPSQSDVAAFSIKNVRVRNGQRGRNVEISYEENGVQQIFALTLEDLDGMSIVEVHNQPEIVWRRK